jgi:hypothetical protein
MIPTHPRDSGQDERAPALLAEFEQRIYGDANLAQSDEGIYLDWVTECKWRGFLLARQAAPAPASEQAALIVSTSVTESAVVVVVSMKRGDTTYVLYSKNHVLNGETLGTAGLPVELANSIYAPTDAPVDAQADTSNTSELDALADGLSVMLLGLGKRVSEATSKNMAEALLSKIGRAPASAQADTTASASIDCPECGLGAEHDPSCARAPAPSHKAATLESAVRGALSEANRGTSGRLILDKRMEEILRAALADKGAQS